VKRQALDHTKMDLLMEKLSVPRYAAVGILESLWHLTAREAPRGDIGKLSNERIAIGIDWRGSKNRSAAQEANRLVQALMDAGWIEVHAECRFIIHDWHEHADEAVKKMLARGGKTFLVGSGEVQAKGCAPSIYIVQASGRDKVKIGFTEGSVEHRLKALQTGCPESLALLASFPGTKAEEVALHKRFSQFALVGEWFELSPEIEEFVRQRQTTADNGRPPEPVPVPVPADQSQRQNPAALIALVAPPEWKSDEVFTRFVAEYKAIGDGLFIDEDFIAAYRYSWKLLDWEQKGLRISAFAEHLPGFQREPSFVPKPEKYLKQEWKRRPREPPQRPQKGATTEQLATLFPDQGRRV